MKNVNYAKHVLAKIAVFMFALILCVGFSQGDVWAKGKGSNKKVKSVTVKINGQNYTNKTYQVKKGKKVYLKVTVNPSKAKKSVKYWSKNEKVATVNKKGKVTAKKNGTAKIKVKVKGKKGKSKTVWVKIKVTNSPKNNASVQNPAQSSTTSSSNQANGFKIYVNNRHVTSTSTTRNQAVYVAVDNGGEYSGSKSMTVKYAEWSSNNPSVIDVASRQYFSSMGKNEAWCEFTAKKPGNAVISVYAVAKDGSSKTVSINVTVNEDANYRTVNGTTFYFVNGLNQGLDKADATIRPIEGNFNRKDITIEINGVASKLVQDYSAKDRTLTKDRDFFEYFGGLYEIGTWPNIYGYVRFGMEKSGDIYVGADPGTATGSYDVTMYYKGAFLAKWHAYRNLMNGEVKILSDCRAMENSCWTSNMTVEEKLHAIEKAFAEKYSYNGDGMTCLEGTQYLVIAARDLGLEAWARLFSYPMNGTRVWDWEKGFGDDFQFAAIRHDHLGHIGMVAVINGKEVVFNTQGHAD